MSKGKTNSGTGGASKSSIIVHAPTGSTVYIENQDGKRKDTGEKNGVWTFRGCDVGIWTVYASLGSKNETAIVNIAEESQLMRYYVDIAYRLFASDFTFYLAESLDTPAVLGEDYQIVYDNDEAIPQDQWPTAENWKIRNLVTLYCVPLKDGKIDVFCVGGGSSSARAGGGSGGYTRTEFGIDVNKNMPILIVIGDGGAKQDPGTLGYPGGDTAFGDIVANGGQVSGNTNIGCPGGSGGGGGGTTASKGGDGGSDGNSGEAVHNPGGEGQGSTTREFGEPEGKLYSGGGGGCGNTSGNGGDGGGGDGGTTTTIAPTAGEPNTGGGAGGHTTSGGSSSSAKIPAPGGSGIVVFRNAREVA